MINDDDPCPCGGGRYGDCCGPRLSGDKPAETPEALMRSRYTGFALGEPEYLKATWHPDKRPSKVTIEPDLRWLGLKIVDTADGDGPDEGFVEFVARHKKGGGPAGRISERSRFRRIDGLWYYLDGVHG